MEKRQPFLITNLSKILVGITIAAVLTAFVVLGLYLHKFRVAELSDKTIAWAEFGDYVGGTLSAVFSFFALIALVITLKVQAYEVHLSTEELRNSAKALADQGRYLAKQTFENTFFQLLRIHADIVASIDLRAGVEVRASGRDCIKIYYNRFKASMKTVERGDFENSIVGTRKVYSETFDRYESDLGHYFRHLYRTFKFIDESEVDDKRAYAGIVRAQLSSDELAFLFFNGIGQFGEKFRDLIEQYGLLENLRSEQIPLWNELNTLYKPTAFGQSSS